MEGGDELEGNKDEVERQHLGIARFRLFSEKKKGSDLKEPLRVGQSQEDGGGETLGRKVQIKTDKKKTDTKHD